MRKHLPTGRTSEPAPRRRSRSVGRALRPVAALLAVALLVAACGEDPGGGGGPTATTVPEGFSVAVAGYDMAVDTEPRRFIVGLQGIDQRLVNFGTVTMRFAWLGEAQPQQATATPSITAEGTWLPIPGVDASDTGTPRLTNPSEARGVYAADVAFDRPGFWGVEVLADLDGEGPRRGTAAFEVAAEHAIPDVGEEAIKSANLTVDSDDVPPAAIDSRAGEGEVPDAALHETTIAEAVAAKRPAVVVFSTPVYCVSQFCGPITDMVAEVAAQEEYADRAEFIHVEIWRDFEKRELNRAAAEWIFRNEDANEPWVFVIGADGRIAARFDNVMSRGELTAVLDALPGSGG